MPWTAFFRCVSLHLLQHELHTIVSLVLLELNLALKSSQGSREVTEVMQPSDVLQLLSSYIFPPFSGVYLEL